MLTLAKAIENLKFLKISSLKKCSHPVIIYINIFRGLLLNNWNLINRGTIKSKVFRARVSAVAGARRHSLNRADSVGTIGVVKYTLQTLFCK